MFDIEKNGKNISTKEEGDGCWQGRTSFWGFCVVLTREQYVLIAAWLSVFCHFRWGVVIFRSWYCCCCCLATKINFSKAVGSYGFLSGFFIWVPYLGSFFRFFIYTVKTVIRVDFLFFLLEISPEFWFLDVAFLPW